MRIAGSRNRIINPNHFSSGLTVEQLEEMKITSGKTKGFSAKDYLSMKRKPLLIFYFMELKDDENEGKKKVLEVFEGEPLLGFAIGFPSIEESHRVKYRENLIKQKEQEEAFNDNDDEEEEDD